MFGFILKFVKGLIVGWIVSLMMYLAKRVISKAFGVDAISPKSAQPQRKSNPYKTNSANQNSQDVVDTIWVGMSVDQLLKSFGEALTKQYVAGGEVWTYLNLNGQGTQTAITIRNGMIVTWQDIRPRAAAPFAAPAP